MSGTRGSLARIVAIGVALALALLLLAAKEATAAKYSVAQCGWYVGADASWADTTGGAKFRQDGWCVPPSGHDPFDGVHLKSLTRGGGTVSGTRFARWRWEALPGTVITRVTGTWWHALHDGIEQRLGVADWRGGFEPFATASATDTTPRTFVAGFSSGHPAFEDRLLCARSEDKWCGLDSESWSGLRALTITLEDDATPVPGPATGPLVAGGWRRGDQMLEFSDTDVGGGIRWGETLLDGARVDLTEYPCAKAMIDGEWRATQMRPCWTYQTGGRMIQTRNFSDGPHALTRCATDFAGNPACLFPVPVLIDNNPPAHPRGLAVAGGDGWRSKDDFDLGWANPDQGAASPVGGASWRVEGSGYDSGVRFTGAHDLTALRDLSVPRAGAYSISVWLRDEAGNEAPASAVSVPLRFDDVPPSVAFDPAPAGNGPSDQVSARIADANSGAAGGEIHYRRLESQQWSELPARFQAEPSAPGTGRLLARLPGDLTAGTYVFRADALDAAGNAASTTRTADNAEMTVRITAAAAASVKKAEPVDNGDVKTRIFARLVWRSHLGSSLTVPFGATSSLQGRLLDAEGAGLARRKLRIVSRPSRGALGRLRAAAVRTGVHGGFELVLPPGTSRRIAVSFAGDGRFKEAMRAPLTLRVRGGVELAARPRSLRNGEAIRLRGRVRTFGAPVPRRGKLVAIQYFETAARRWRPILVTRSDHSGRFRAAYRFRYVTGTATIRLRALALPEGGWPYAPGASRPVAVHVIG